MSQGAENMNNSGNSGERLPRVPTFAVSVGEKFIIKKREDPALKVTDDGQGQLGH